MQPPSARSDVFRLLRVGGLLSRGGRDEGLAVSFRLCFMGRTRQVRGGREAAVRGSCRRA